MNCGLNCMCVKLCYLYTHNTFCTPLCVCSEPQQSLRWAAEEALHREPNLTRLVSHGHVHSSHVKHTRHEAPPLAARSVHRLFYRLLRSVHEMQVNCAIGQAVSQRTGRKSSVNCIKNRLRHVKSGGKCAKAASGSFECRLFKWAITRNMTPSMQICLIQNGGRHRKRFQWHLHIMWQMWRLPAKSRRSRWFWCQSDCVCRKIYSWIWILVIY